MVLSDDNDDMLFAGEHSDCPTRIRINIWPVTSFTSETLLAQVCCLKLKCIVIWGYKVVPCFLSCFIRVSSKFVLQILLPVPNDVQVKVRTWTWLGLKSNFYRKWTWLGRDLNILKCGGLYLNFLRWTLTWLEMTWTWNYNSLIDCCCFFGSGLGLDLTWSVS